VKRFTYILIFVLVFSFPTIVHGATHTRLVINHEEIVGLDVPPIIINNRVMVPARGVFERVGGRVEWNQNHRQVTVYHGSDVLIMTINETVAWRNGEPVMMDDPPIIHNNRTMIPLRFTSEAFGFFVDWDSAGRAAIINSINPNGPELEPGPGQGLINIISVSAPPRDGSQVFTITASSAIPALESFSLYGNRLVLDFPNSRTNLNGSISIPYYSPVIDVRASQFSADVSRIVFELPNGADYNIVISDDRLRVLVTIYADANNNVNDNTSSDVNVNNNTSPEIVGINPNIRYVSGAIRIPKNAGFTMNNATHNNVYRNNQYIISLPIDASSILGTGTVPVTSPMIYSFTIARNTQGNTDITIRGRRIIAVDIDDTGAYYLIRIMHPRERYSRIVVIDPGHGGQPGAVYNGVHAANLNLAIASKLVQLIEECGSMRAFTTRSTDITVRLADRARFANDIGCIMVTIHHNAWHNTDTRGVETFYFPSERDALRSLTGQELAATLQRQLVAHTGRIDREHRSNSFAVLRYSNIPAALIEVGFMSNPQEFATLIAEEYQWRVAQAIYEGLMEAFLILEN